MHFIYVSSTRAHNTNNRPHSFCKYSMLYVIFVVPSYKLSIRFHLCISQIECSIQRYNANFIHFMLCEGIKNQFVFVSNKHFVLRYASHKTINDEIKTFLHGNFLFRKKKKNQTASEQWQSMALLRWVHSLPKKKPFLFHLIFTFYFFVFNQTDFCHLIVNIFVIIRALCSHVAYLFECVRRGVENKGSFHFSLKCAVKIKYMPEIFWSIFFLLDFKLHL